jgi:hypothetical protein
LVEQHWAGWEATTSTPASPHYRAFLSYSHKDRPWADWLHRALETYRIDRDLVGRKTSAGEVPRTLRPIFRDRDDFAGGSSLREATLRAIEASEFLLVICSPNSAASKYVNEEVRLFKAMGRSSRVISVIVDGEPNDPARECFPPAVRFTVGQDGQITTTIDDPIAAVQQAVDKLTSVTGALTTGTGRESVENSPGLTYLLHQAQQVADKLKSIIIATFPNNPEQTLATNELGWAYQKVGDILLQQNKLAAAKIK